MGTIEYIDGFDDYVYTQASAQGWTPSGATIGYRFVPAEVEGYKMVLYNEYVSRSITADARYTVGMSFSLSTITVATALISLYESTQLQGYLYWNADGTFQIKRGDGTNLATSSATGLAPNATHHIEFDYTIGDTTTGYYELRLDGTTIIASPSPGVDTRNGGTSGVANILRLTAANSIFVFFDDLVVTKGGGFQGQCRVVTDHPDTDGANTAWAATNSTLAYQTYVSAERTDGGSLVWPTHAVGDYALLFIETCGGEPMTITSGSSSSPPTNDTFELLSTQYTGTGTAGTRLTVWGARAFNTSMPNVVMSDPGDHIYAVMLTYRNVKGGDVIVDVIGGGSKESASTSFSADGVTTTKNGDMVIVAISRDNDSATAEFSGWTNANLTSITERWDVGTTQGNGGGLGIAEGVMASAGATGATTGSTTNSVVNAFVTIALRASTGDYGSVDDQFSTDDSDYLSSSTPGDRDTFTFPALGVSGTVKAVAISHVSRKDDSGDRKVVTVVRAGSTNYDNASTQTLATGYAAQQQIYEADPSTATAWVDTDIDSREYGIKLDT